jgi:hypothetical protein
MEDSLEGNRPPWDEVGATVTSDVAPYELRKLRLLNAGHSCMAYLAALAGIERVDAAVAEPIIDRFLRRFLESEAGPGLPEIPGIDVPAEMRRCSSASLIRRQESRSPGSVSTDLRSSPSFCGCIRVGHAGVQLSCRRRAGVDLHRR